ncbi:MAG: GHMP kinase [Chloroflexia bacterium]|nr:GHMP kinase [Chloroflexia bacterium]
MSIVARAPVRLSFGGGGTDLPAYYDRHGGFVVSAAISRYAMATASPAADGAIGVNSADYRVWLRWPSGVIPDPGEPLSLPRAVLAWFAERDLLPAGVDLFLASEVPPGSGLGSSSAMTVATIQALAAFARELMTTADVADLASHIEIERLGRPIGKQDHYAAVFGGLNAISFAASGVAVEPLTLPPGTLDRLERGLLLFSTGMTRDSASILTGQQASTAEDPATVHRLHALKALAHEMRAALEAGDLDGFGALLDDGWRIKRGINRGISSAAIDRWYEAGRAAGAFGGKIAGAGGGGFLLLYAPPAARSAVTAALLPEGLRPLAFSFAPTGATTAAMPVGPSGLALSLAGETR